MPKLRHDRALIELRTFGLAYPGAHLKSPWPGHKDLAVNDKTFAYLNLEGQPFSISCKLPSSASLALSLPNTQPTGYGLGKSGWVSLSVPTGEAVPTEMLKAWIDESYRAQAPKKLLRQLDAERAPHGAKPASSQARPKPAIPARRPKAKSSVTRRISKVAGSKKQSRRAS